MELRPKHLNLVNRLYMYLRMATHQARQPVLADFCFNEKLIQYKVN